MKLEQGMLLSLFSSSSLTTSILDELARQGARRMIETALQAEVAEYIARFQHLVDEDGHRLVVRNGTMPEREIATGAGMLTLRQPRVNDRRQAERFTSQILPRYARRSPTLDVLIPVLYLKGISTGDFSEAFEALLGEAAAG